MLSNTLGKVLSQLKMKTALEAIKGHMVVGSLDPNALQSPAWIGEYNESMNCQVKDELVSQLVALNNKLNLLSPDLVHGDEERSEVQQQRENLYTEIKHHRAKGHEGKPCPAAKQVWASRL
jgi:hypothetical protein